jgi:uncharacterized OB-fold protein
MMATSTFQPVPPVNEFTRPFWEGGLQNELRLQRCSDCGHIRYPLSTICPKCLSAAYEWQELSGRGVVQSFVIFDRAYHDDWKDDVPYVVALIALDEGPVFLTNVVGVPPSDVQVGQHVKATFGRRSAEAALPQFTPVDKEIGV